MNKVAHFQVAAGRIDRKRGTIYGVAVITAGEAKGHGLRVDMTTLEQVMDCAKNYIGGLAVRFAEEDHGGGAANIIGNLRNWTIDGEVLRADLQLLKAHPDFALVVEMAETMPEAFGLSIVFSGQHEQNEAGMFARCTELYGCDIVKNPAANPTGLFSAPVDTKEPSNMSKEKTKDIEVELSQTSAALKDAETKLTGQTEQLTALAAERDLFKADLQTAVTALESEKAAHAKDIEALQSAATEINALKEAVKLAEQSAGKKAQEALSAIGVPAVEQPAIASQESPIVPTNRADAEKQLAALTKEDPAKARAFYLKHKPLFR